MLDCIYFYPYVVSLTPMYRLYISAAVAIRATAAVASPRLLYPTLLMLVGEKFIQTPLTKVKRLTGYSPEGERERERKKNCGSNKPVEVAATAMATMEAKRWTLE